MNPTIKVSYFISFLLALAFSIGQLSAGDDINYINLGNKAFLKGQLSKALDLYSKAGRACEETDKVYNNKGVVYASKGQPAIAILKFTKALEYNPENATIYYNRATQYLLKGDYEAAILDYQKADSGHTSESAQKQAYNLAVAYYLAQKYKKALSYLSNNDAVHDSYPLSYLAGLINYELNDYVNAAIYFNVAHQNSGDLAAQYAYSAALYAAGEKEMALSVLQELCQEKLALPEWISLYTQLSLQADAQTVSSDSFKKLLDRNDSDSYAWSGLGTLLLQEGRVAEAEKHFSKALESDKKNVQALNGQAAIVLLSGDKKKAMALYEKANELVTNDQSLFGLAEAAMTIPDPFTCLAALDKIDQSNLEPAQGDQYLLLKVTALSRINKMDQAYRLLRKRSWLPVNHAAAMTQLAFCSMKLSKYEEVIKLVSRNNFDNYLPYLIAGNAALTVNEASKAYRFFRRAEQLSPTQPDVQMGIALALSEQRKSGPAMQLIDSLVTAHPTSHYMANARGIIYKDQGLEYKNAYSNAKAASFFERSEAAFANAGAINPNMKSSFDNNKALAIYYQGRVEESRQMLEKGNSIAASNNLALVYVHNKKYRKAIHILDSLNVDYQRRYEGKTSVQIDHNLALARWKEKMNNNYKFITYYFTHQDRPVIQVKNLFHHKIKPELPIKIEPQLDYILEYSEVECPEVIMAKRKKARAKKQRRQKQSRKGECPSF